MFILKQQQRTGTAIAHKGAPFVSEMPVLLKKTY
jgi:hypothetical protein